MPRTLTLGLLSQLQVDDDRHVVGQRRVAARERVVPVEAELGPVHRGLQLETEALAAVRIGGRVCDAALDLDGLGVALEGQLAGNREVVARPAGVSRGEAEAREPLCVEELGALKMRLQVRVLDLNAGHLGRPADDTVRQAGVEVRKRALEGARHVRDREADRRVDLVDAPGSGREGPLCGLAGHWCPLRCSGKLASSSILAREGFPVNYHRLKY